MLLLIILLLGTGSTFITIYFAVEAIQDWLYRCRCSEYRVSEYIRILTYENEQYVALQAELEVENDRLRNEISGFVVREITWLDERKRLLARNNMMANELTLDDMNKKTQVIPR